VKEQTCVDPDVQGSGSRGPAPRASWIVLLSLLVLAVTAGALLVLHAHVPGSERGRTAALIAGFAGFCLAGTAVTGYLRFRRTKRWRPDLTVATAVVWELAAATLLSLPLLVLRPQYFALPVAGTALAAAGRRRIAAGRAWPGAALQLVVLAGILGLCLLRPVTPGAVAWPVAAVANGALAAALVSTALARSRGTAAGSASAA
jgi:hypothetical protein